MRYIAFLFRTVAYIFIFITELIVANIQVAMMVLSPRLKFNCAAIKHKSKMKTKAELILITNSITLTPGTLVMDANLEKGEIMVHAMSRNKLDSIKEGLKRFPESRVLWAMRGENKKSA